MTNMRCTFQRWTCRPLLFLLALILIPAFAYADTLTVSTGKTTYTRGEVMKITAVYKTNAGTPITRPTTREIRIKNPAGKEVAKKSMANVGNGIYTYNYTLPSTAPAGKWEVRGKFVYKNVETKGYTYPTVVTSTTDTTAPVTSAAPATSSFSTSITVNLTRNEIGTTYYTTNGTIPTTASAVYSTPLTFSATTTLKYFSRDSVGNSEAIKTSTYTKTATVGNPHASLTWTGYNMCHSCHATQASDVFHSVHYQWQGASGMTTGPAIQGKFSPTVDNSTAMNSYCINILGNWNNYSGCSNCHVGLGLPPSTTADTAQLDNIDCLICHQKDYKRARSIYGGTYSPNTAAMTITMDQAVQTVSKPTRSTCLQCHAKGGGGDNFKRGDLALAHGTTNDATFDVHMSTGRGNLTCQTCHTTSSHKMAGRGSDLRPKESAAAINCSTSSCHPGKASLSNGHSTAAVNHHTGRVSCQACHIRTYAKNAADTPATEATETFRTWKTSEWNATLNRYEPMITLANNLTPRYAFWNGSSWGSNLLDTPVIDPATGAYKISRPNGAISDPAGTKLYPFKYKTSEAPFNTDRRKLISVDTSIYFKTGSVADAVNQGMVNMGYSAGEPYSWVMTDEFQLITHEVPTASGNVLACADCHKNTARVNLPAMGYALKGAKSTVCTQCHEDESYSGYTWIHDKHVTDKKYDCSFCHSFSRATERGLRTTR